ncbi:MAG: hypothetical protein J0L92_40375 [Deltaproteobacteria bacterium]|nr:hypothetical protein [Deltaproteobacteria bacterium]
MTRALALMTALVATLALGGCRPSQCGARNEPCCEGTCLADMACVSDVCRAPCAGPLDACDAVTGTGCPEGSVCRPDVRGDTILPTCVPGVAGTAQRDGPCAVTDDCAPGLWCYRGTCRFLCCGVNDDDHDGAVDRDDDDCDDPLQYCVPFEGVGLCDGDDDCDLFAQTGCPPEQACHAILLVAGGYTRSCFRAGTTTYGQPCTRHGDCVAGHRCIDAGNEDGARCWPICDGAHGCATGECAALEGDPGFGFCPP